MEYVTGTNQLSRIFSQIEALLPSRMQAPYFLPIPYLDLNVKECISQEHHPTILMCKQQIELNCQIGIKSVIEFPNAVRTHQPEFIIHHLKKFI